MLTAQSAGALGANRLKSWTSTFDWVLLGLVLAISVIGVINLRSAAGVLPEPLHGTQLLLLAGGFFLFFAPAAIVDYRFYERWSYLLYGTMCFIVFLVLVVGDEYNGARRWLNMGLFQFQPSEPMKIGVILVVARYFATRDKRDGYSLIDLAVPAALVAVPFVLILRQPDLGTAMHILLIAFSLALFEKIKTSSLVLMLIAALAFAPVAWLGLEDYQKGRIKTFLQIEEDPYGRDWQVKNSVIAVGAGGMWGRGFQQGTQIQKGFVPEPENDFALANWAEEQGFVGASLLLALYLALILWSLRIARLARDRFGTLVALGIAAMIFWQVLINVGMVVRWMPVVGITLPLVSYGGSSVFTILGGIGLLMNISVRRHALRA